MHALAQVAHLELYTDLPPETLRARINDALPHDIYLRTIDRVPHRFHARHDAVSRSYLYQIARRKSAFFKPYVWWVKERLDVDQMRVAAAAFVGMKDFASFTADEPDEKSTRVLVDRLEIAEDGALLLVRIQGSHFLWRMVRRLVGVLAAVGRGELTPGDAAGFLDERSNAPAVLTAPGSGLFLEGVYYQEGRRTRTVARHPAASSRPPIVSDSAGASPSGRTAPGIVARVSRRSPCRRETTSS